MRWQSKTEKFFPL